MKKYVAMVMSAVFIVLAILFTVPTKVVVVGKGDGTSEKITTIESFVEAIEAMINFDFDSFVHDNASVKLLSGDSAKKYESFTSESSVVISETYEYEEYIDKDGKIVDIYNEGVDVDELQKITVKHESSADFETKAYFTQTGIYMDVTYNEEEKDKSVDTDQSFYNNATIKGQMYLSCEGEFFINLEQFAVSGDNTDEIIEQAGLESVLSLVGKKWIQVNDSEDFVEDFVEYVIQLCLGFGDSTRIDDDCCRFTFKYMDRYINTDAILKQDKQYSINPDYYYHANTFLNWGSFDESVNWSEISEICSSCGLDSGIFDGCQTYGEVCDLLLPYYDVLYKSSNMKGYNLSLKVDLSDSISPMYSFGVEGSDGYKFSSKTKITNINNTVCKFDKSTVRYSVDFDELFGDE